MSYYTAFICENGHPVSTSSYSCSDKFCSKCGKPVVSSCSHCSQVIKGKYDGQLGTLADYKVPSYCPKCGKPYPWTSAAIEATAYMLEESELSAEDQKKLIDVLPDVLTETPKTQLASMRFKKAMSAAGSFVAEGLRDFAISFGCEVFKNYIGLS